MDAAAAVAPPRTLLDDVLASVLTPGVGPGLVATINGALLVLVAVLLGLLGAGAADVHTAVLLTLALGLLGAVNFHVGQLRAAEELEGQRAAGGDEAAPAEPAAPAEAAVGTGLGGGGAERGAGTGARRRRRD